MGIRYDGELYAYVYPHVKDALIFDIGSNIGEVTKKFLRAGAKVVAVEPQKELTTNKNYKGVTAIKNVCISSKKGEVTFYKAPKSNSVSTCLVGWKKRHPSTNFIKSAVPAITLDTLIEEFGKPTYIKIDVEGYEHEVLSCLSHKIDFISFEFTQGYSETFYKAIEVIEKLGFKKMTTFQKKKIKKMINGKRKIVDKYRIVNEFTNISSIIEFFDNLPEATQGDILIEA